VLVGNRALLRQRGIALDTLHAQAEDLAAQGATPMYVAVDGVCAGLIAVADTLRAESREAVAQLEALGLEVWMLTGDNQRTAQAVAREAGIRHVLAELLPQHKAAQVQQLQAAGKVVAMVGDGINDAPALAQADLGIAIGAGSDVAMAASDITLVGGDLRAIVTAIALSRRTVSTIKQGLVWAFGYNIVLIPVAMGLLHPFFGIRLSPVLAAAAMAMSSVSVVTNALRLRGFRRPASASAILHPPLLARVREVAYLGGIALVALVIGALAITYAQPEDNMATNSGMGRAMPAASRLGSGVVVDRTIVLDAGDNMRFNPGDIQVAPGETVAFTVTNTGQLKHEFLIGDATAQAEHDQEMAQGEEEAMGMDGEQNVVDLAPGETQTLVYTFGPSGTLLYGCHEPGHYAAGMSGTITISAPPS
jgi:Cu+-exporting ATPase